uniref:ATP-dependent DNA ligase family profile domain-containing protein n=1 Tax=Mycena chlorophos TaxID=658473 RepID=A0ABQ0KVP6_MYCCL|nr:predicted protein [Mycena chlorophos]
MSSPPFAFFVSLLDEMSGSKSPVDVFKRWIQRLRRETSGSELAQGSAVTLFRLLFPQDDTRRKYGMQEKLLANAIADALGTSAKPLRKWDQASGCLGIEVEKVMQNCSSLDTNYTSPLTMAEVDLLLDELAAGSGFTDESVRKKLPGSRRPKTIIMRSLYRDLTPRSAAWLTQILLKDLRPMLYPLPATHYTAALISSTSFSFVELTKEDSMRAWDPTGRLLHNYRSRSRLDDAVSAFEAGEAIFFTPSIGQPVPIPKALKGRGCQQALEPLCKSKCVWAERKMDGERVQAHVELNDGPRIKIFSKSLRDSTLDRNGIHDLILESLGLQHGSTASLVTSNVIVEAEMVAWHGDKIDEFWRIHTLVEHTAHGVRRRPFVPNDEIYTQSSLKTDIADRHLGLVFFDILLLNGRSLLAEPYSFRRSVLESVIRLVPARSMLVGRALISTRDGSLGETIQHALASCAGPGEEGLVLKAAEGRYNDKQLPWVKLKKDYIPGYGDNLDFALLGVGWDPERARELRVSTDCVTTFYFGGLKNAADLEKDPTARPHFYLYFMSSYGLSRQELETSTFYFRDIVEKIPYSTAMNEPSKLPFTLTVLPGLEPRPTHILLNPLLAELYGAGFTKAKHSKAYALRFPRVVKLFRPHERTWREGVSLQALHQIARETMCRDRADKEIDDWANTTWNKPVSPLAVVKRKPTIDQLEEQLLAADRNKRRRRESPMTLRLERTLAPMVASVALDSNPNAPAQAVGAHRPHVQVLKPLNTPATPPSDPSIPSLMTNAAVFLATHDMRLRKKWKRIIPEEHVVHCLDSLLRVCGWSKDDVGASTARRGIILLSIDESEYRQSLVEALHQRKSSYAQGVSIWLLEENVFT